VGGDMWEYQMTFLVEAGLRCIAHDRRGCGRSGDPGRGFEPDTCADDLARLIDDLDLSGVTLVAHSMGAGEVARYLARHGTKRISRVVLVAPTTPFSLKTADNPEGVDKVVFEATLKDLGRDRPRWLAENARSFFGLPSSNVSAEIVQWGTGLALRASPLATTEIFRSFSSTDFRPDMRTFTIPTLVVHGDVDQQAPLELTGRRTARLISGSRLQVYEGAPHGLFVTHKEALNRDLLAFINA
jgi:pimeloyl-ACP methyl ester carboxylesterase